METQASVSSISSSVSCDREYRGKLILQSLSHSHQDSPSLWFSTQYEVVSLGTCSGSGIVWGGL